MIGCEATRVPCHARDDYVFNLGVEVVRRGAIDLLSFFDFPVVFLCDTSPPPSTDYEHRLRLGQVFNYFRALIKTSH